MSGNLSSFKVSQTKVHTECDSDLANRIKMTVFESILTTFEANITFEAPGAVKIMRLRPKTLPQITMEKQPFFVLVYLLIQTSYG